MTDDILGAVLARIAEFEVEARTVLGKHEATPERVITLEQSYAALGKLTLDQDELFREALRAVEQSLFRAAHVLAWAGFIDFLHNYLWDGYEADVARERPAWLIHDSEDFREHADFQVIELGKIVGAYGKTVMKALHGLLNTRNECAHPSDYFPDLNDALGYVSNVFKRIDYLQQKATT